MSVELRPLGVNCNIKCQYCYQNPQRDAGNLSRNYDIELMKAAIEKEGGPFTMFGGEPLLVKEEDLEELWSWGFQRYGRNGIQTNGTLINENHIRMFKQYRVHVGISIDGPSELNDIRWVGSLEATRKATEKIEENIKRLCNEGIPPSLIVTLHQLNATSDKLPRMYQWTRHLDALGIPSVRLHVLESESEFVRQTYSLPIQENIEALLSFAELEKDLKNLKFDVFRDLENLLLGLDRNAACVWRACDPYTTSAVRGVEGHGQRSNCGRTNKEGIDFVKADIPGYERYIALYHTPQKYGGCQGCRFFLMCKGQCPGTALNGDWRNRTEHCEIWLKLFQHIESQLLDRGAFPISAQPIRKTIEDMILTKWANGSNALIQDMIEVIKQ
jgi:uncharacterized protein